MSKNVFKDSKGKNSMKRILGALGVLVALIMALLPFFYSSKYEPSDTLIIGILGASFAAISFGVFEGSRHVGNRPDDRHVGNRPDDREVCNCPDDRDVCSSKCDR
jgi:peptidoglycan/LPS O-acetylase OafA/YrhL